MRRLIAAVSVFLLMVGNAAFAQTADDVKAQAKALLTKLSGASGTGAPEVFVPRSGAFHVNATFVKKSAFATPLLCTTTILYLGRKLQTVIASQPVVFSGDTADCNASVAFKWRQVDTAGGLAVSLMLISIPGASSAATGVSNSWTMLRFGPPQDGATIFNFGKLAL